MNHDAGVGKGITLPFRTRRQQEGPHRRRHPHADRLHVGLDELHRVINAEAGVDTAAGAVDVKRDVFVRIFAFQEKKLRDYEIRAFVVDFTGQKDDAVAQQARINIKAALAAPALFNHHRNEHVAGKHSSSPKSLRRVSET